MAQQSSSSSSSRLPNDALRGSNSAKQPQAPQAQDQSADQGEPAGTNHGPGLMDPAGPQVSLQTSEPVFDMAVALNACGYNDGLNESDPVRLVVRREVNQVIEKSPQVQQDRNRLCRYLNDHQLNDPSQSLAQYVSLALYLSRPPRLTPTVPESNLPPDAVGVELMLPLLRRFVNDADLHLIWLENRPAYDAIVQHLHGALTQMIVKTNYYLKMPASTANGLRFLVVIEPMLSPEETNMRVYGTDYVVVASPKHGQIYMRQVRHAYLHFVIEPMLYYWQGAMTRMEPILKTVQDAPLQFNFKNSIMSLTVESLIKAIEARITNTGVKVTQVPSGLTHSQAVPYMEARRADLEKVAEIRERWVERDMAQGFVMTGYFYKQLIQFEKSPESLGQAIGPIVYGMDINSEISVAKHVVFAKHGAAETMTHSAPAPKGLELAQLDLVNGKTAAAMALAQEVVTTQKGNVGRANFILAQGYLMSGKMQDAEAAFRQAVVNAEDPRTLAWSHIFLGRILDVKGDRARAIAQYRAALAAGDDHADTRQAANAGLQKPYTIPSEQTVSEATGKPVSTKPAAPAAPSASGNSSPQ